jgi:hypothetical protein
VVRSRQSTSLVLNVVTVYCIRVHYNIIFGTTVINLVTDMFFSIRLSLCYSSDMV